MKKCISIFFSLAIGSAFGQAEHSKVIRNTPPGENEKIAVITGYLEGSPNDSLVQLWDPYNGQFDTTRIKNHRFTLHTPIPHGGCIQILSIGAHPTPETGARVLYVESGKMSITGKGSSLHNVTLKGDPWVQEWNEVYAMIDPDKPEVKKYADLEKSYHEAMAIGDEDAADKYSKEGDLFEKARKKKMMDWISKHPNSGISVYLMSYFQDKQEREVIFAMLKDHAKDSRIYKRLKFPNTVDPLPGTVKLDQMDTAAMAKMGMVTPGRPAPDFSIPDVDGKTLTLADFKGKYLFLDFWASWCGPCVDQIPFLKKVNEKFKDKNFVMLGISLDSKKEGWLKGIQKHGLDWMQASSLRGWAEPAARGYGVSAIPFNCLIGPDGKVLAIGLAGDDGEKKMTELIK